MYSYAHVHLFCAILRLEPLRVRQSSLISSANLRRRTFIRKKILGEREKLQKKLSERKEGKGKRVDFQFYYYYYYSASLLTSREIFNGRLWRFREFHRLL